MLIFSTRHEKTRAALTGPAEFYHLEPQIDPSGGLAWSIAEEALHGVTEVVPAFTDRGSLGIVSRFVVSAVDRAGFRSVVSLDWLGGSAPGAADRAASSGLLEVGVDTVKINAPLRSLEVKLQCREHRVPSKEALVTISLRRRSASSRGLLRLSEGELQVPVLSQFESSPTIGHRICSPTSVAMVLAYYGFAADPAAVAAEAFVPSRDLYGVWPANVRAAAERGLIGGLCHIESWDTVDHFLRRNIPLIASIRYKPAELSNAAFYRGPDDTVGHLVVVCGYGGGKIIVNDPAGKTAAEVRRGYDHEEFARVWFDRSAMAYILIP